MVLSSQGNSDIGAVNQSKNRSYAVSIAAVIVSFFGFIQYIGVEFSDWHILLITIIRFLSVILSVTAFYLVRRGKAPTAGILLIGLSIVNGLAIAYIFTGSGFSVQLGIVGAGIIISLELLTGKARVATIFISIIMGFLAYASDFLPVLWRIQSTSSDNRILPSLIILFLFSLYIFLTFSSFGIRYRLLLIFLGVNLIATVMVAGVAQILTRQALEKITTTKLVNTAQNLADDVDTFINANLEGVQSKATSPSLAAYLSLPKNQRSGSDLESKVLNLLISWGRQDPFFIESIGILDLNGVIVMDLVNEDTGKSEANFKHFTDVVENGSPYASPILTFYAKNSVWHFSSPIRNEQNKIVGVLRLRYHGGILQSIAVKYNNRVGEKSFGVLLDEYGIILAHGSESEYVRRALLGLSDAEMNTLRQEQRLLNIVTWANFLELRAKLTDVSSMESFKTALPLEGPSSLGSAAAVVLENSSWRAVVFQSDEIKQSQVNTQTNSIILITEFVFILVFFLGSITTKSFTKPILVLTDTARALSTGDRNIRVNLNTADELGVLAKTFNSMADQLGNTLQTLEKRIQDRSHALEVGAEVGRRISNILEISPLIYEVVNLLQETFGYHHVHIYLLEEESNILYLAGGTGSVGQQLLKNKHQVVQGRSLVGKAAIQRSVIFLPDTSQDYTWLPNPLIPDTQSEMAVPIILGEKVLGVLDVQSDLPYGLDEDDVYLLQLVAGQTAIAFRNARQLDEARHQAKKHLDLSQITGKIRNTTELERAIKVAVRELGKNLTGAKIIARYYTRKPNTR
jgi:putative methionine-R-sulfoxide reductase with GAF domain